MKMKKKIPENVKNTVVVGWIYYRRYDERISFAEERCAAASG